MLSLSIVQGTDESWSLQANTPFGPASGNSALLSSDVYTAQLWPGGNAPMIFAPAVIWLSAATVRLMITAAQSGGLNFGATYLVNVYRNRGSTHECIGIIQMVCLPSPRP